MDGIEDDGDGGDGGGVAMGVMMRGLRGKGAGTNRNTRGWARLGCSHIQSHTPRHTSTV